MDQNNHQRARNLYPRTTLHQESRPRDRTGGNSGDAQLVATHQNAPAEHEKVAHRSESRPMSMRDFITRVVNAPVAAKATPHSVREITPAIVVQAPLIDPPPAREDLLRSTRIAFYWDIES